MAQALVAEEQKMSAIANSNSISDGAKSVLEAGGHHSKPNIRGARLARWKRMQTVLQEGQCRALIQTIMPDGNDAGVFTERSFDVRGGGRLRLVFPMPVPREGGWCCYLRIEWPNGRISKLPGTGFDRLDAVLTAAQLARITLENFDEWKQGNVTWEFGTDLLLPVVLPSGLRD